ncbi:UDP-N-acetylglucosamine 2-epimerase [uncultured Desulfosarcina sp.]|uniref:UDP-N-acetylglucosamine 2-epimerase n=1 Tax=uncultured Desulfosarcina sp. TaxID=218289 RepID=UPI0029C80E97|nr:UDP-N-acetylglucosamine 2-epimerase [uncultured Desulfosarcina sp.]
MKRKICFVTGTRAEYGLLSRLMEKVDQDLDLRLQIIATCMHLSAEFGNTYQEIESDGFKIDKKVEMLMSSDSPEAICKSMGLALISFPDAYKHLNPDLIVLLGDRFETFCAAAAATVCRIPIAHIHGGECTEGAIDEAFRHSITKMSHLHFTSTEQYRSRVIQLGEKPESVFNVGSLGVENISKLTLLSLKQLENKLDFILHKKYLLVTLHPQTLDSDDGSNHAKQLLNALAIFKDINVIFTKANADAGGRAINTAIEQFVTTNPDRARIFPSLGKIVYFSVLKYAEAVVGNSSSGIIEAPSFKIPTVNIGDRQAGRVQSRSVINCSSRSKAIIDALKIALSSQYKESLVDIFNPYEKKETAINIKNQLKFFQLRNILKKEFNNHISSI